MSLPTNFGTGRGGSAAGPKVYVDDFYSQDSWVGTGGTVKITNDVDLAGQGGMIIMKKTNGTGGHIVIDTVRGRTKYLTTNSNNAEQINTGILDSFDSDGITTSYAPSNDYYFVQCFAIQRGFFDVQTWTGNGVNGRTINHNIDGNVGMIWIKNLDSTEDWYVHHRSYPADYYPLNNANSGNGEGSDRFVNNVTSSSFQVGSNGELNGSSGHRYVAYIFGDNNAYFGPDQNETISVAQSYTEQSTSNKKYIGWEPQLSILRPHSSAGNWEIHTDMYGGAYNEYSYKMFFNTLDGISNQPGYFKFTGDGHWKPSSYWGTGQNIITYHIRRSMKKPTVATDVFDVITYSGNSSLANRTVSNKVVDAIISTRTTSSLSYLFSKRMGTGRYIDTGSTGSGGSQSTGLTRMESGLFRSDSGATINSASHTYVPYVFTRRNGFFDVAVDYHTNGADTTIQNSFSSDVSLDAYIVLNMDNTDDKELWHKDRGTGDHQTTIYLNDGGSGSGWYGRSGNKPVITQYNASGNYQVWMFSSLAGICHVGSYTGNGGTQNIDCGFASGIRMALIRGGANKNFTIDAERGHTGNETANLLNGAEVTGYDQWSYNASGFTVNHTTDYSLNESGVDYYFIAFA